MRSVIIDGRACVSCHDEDGMNAPAVPEHPEHRQYLVYPGVTKSDDSLDPALWKQVPGRSLRDAVGRAVRQTGVEGTHWCYGGSLVAAPDPTQPQYPHGRPIAVTLFQVTVHP